MEGGRGPEAEASSSPICSIAATCLTLFSSRGQLEQAGPHAACSRSLVDKGPMFCVLGD